MGAIAAAVTLAGSALVGYGAVAPDDATALTPPVAMTADDLPTWQTNGVVWAMAQTDGVVFAGGTFSKVRPPGSPAGSNEREAVNFVALDAATGAPTDCKLNFTIGSGAATVRALEVSPDGSTLYAGGDFGSVNGVARSRLAAIDIASCSVKTSFNPRSVSARVHGLDVTPGGRLYMAGEFNSVQGQTRNKFAALDAGSGNILSWRANAGENRIARAIEATPDEQHVVLGGDFDKLNNDTSVHGLAVVRADTGATVRAYKRVSNSYNRPYELHYNSNVKGLYVDESGIYVANEGNGGGVFDGRLALNLGSFTERWRDTCLGATQDVTVYKDVLYSVSHAHNCGSMGQFPEINDRQHMLAESLDNPRPLHSWFPDTDEGPTGTERIGPRTIVTSTSGGKDYMWVGGEFTRILSNGVKYQQGLTRFANGPDTNPPVAVPDQVSAANVTGGVRLRWRASWDRDDSKLTYALYRNGTALGTKPSLDSKFWTRPQGSFTDTDVNPGTTYSYRITASDAAGNTTARSPAVSVTTPGTPTETTVERTPTADAYVNGHASGTNYGTAQQLFARNDPPYASYMRFSLPSAPSGMVLDKASLTVRTSTEETAASADENDVVPVTGSWSEGGVTYAGRPGLSSTVLGTFSGTSELSTEYTVNLSTSGLTGSLGEDFDLALTGGGTDSLKVWSRETSYDPRLVLTFRRS